MISLTYLSTATDPFDAPELAELLEVSRHNNHEAGLTGMLLYADGHFVQTLEGPDAAVEQTFTRIAQNPRHRDILVALREDVDSRSFPDWSMGFEEISAQEAAGLPGFNDYLHAGAISDEDARDYGRAGVFHRVFRDRMR